MQANDGAEIQEFSGQLRDVRLYMHARFADMDKRFDGVDKRFNGVDKRFDSVDKGFDAIDKRFEKAEADIANMKRLMEDRFNAILRAIAEQVAERGSRA